jgi:hypothetical protein
VIRYLGLQRRKYTEEELDALMQTIETLLGNSGILSKANNNQKSGGIFGGSDEEKKSLLYLSLIFSKKLAVTNKVDEDTLHLFNE